MRIVSAVMFAFFVYAVYVQFNDPDPVLWVVGYGIVGIVSLLAAMGRKVGLLAGLIAPVYAAWAIWAVMRTTGHWFDGEAEREAGGLIICAVWLLIVAFTFRRPRHVA